MVAISDMQDVLIAFVSVSTMGFFWFHPAVFGNIWVRHCHITTFSNQNSAMVLTFVSQFIMVVLLKFLMTNVFSVWNLNDALTMGGYLAALVCLSQVSHSAFRRHSWVAFSIEQGYETAVILLACALLFYF